MDFFVHHTAVIDEGATIGKGSRIWHFSHVMPTAVIGRHCSLGQNVFVANDVTIGDRVKIQNNVSLYTGVVCEDEVFLGPSVVLTNVINPRSGVERKNEYQTTLLKKGSTVGANATIVCGVEIGQYAFIGAGAVITQDVPAFALVVGNPGRPIGWMSAHGHRLEFDENGQAICEASGDNYELKSGKVTRIGSTDKSLI